MALETTGKIHAIFDTKQVTERFRKREVVLELTGDRCDRLDQLRVGDEVRVEFSLRGREWTSPKGEVRYFNSLDVWALERMGSAHDADPGPPDDIPPPSDDDIPF